MSFSYASSPVFQSTKLLWYIWRHKVIQGSLLATCGPFLIRLCATFNFCNVHQCFFVMPNVKSPNIKKKRKIPCASPIKKYWIFPSCNAFKCKSKILQTILNKDIKCLLKIPVKTFFIFSKSTLSRNSWSVASARNISLRALVQIKPYTHICRPSQQINGLLRNSTMPVALQIRAELHSGSSSGSLRTSNTTDWSPPGRQGSKSAGRQFNL